MTVREWWDNARERDQATVLVGLLFDHELAGVPWVFLPDEAKEALIWRVRIKEHALAQDWRRVYQEGIVGLDP